MKLRDATTMQMMLKPMPRAPLLRSPVVTRCRTGG
jgi:hypothetical protein